MTKEFYFKRKFRCKEQISHHTVSQRNLKKLMSESESSEFEPYDCYDEFSADLERFTQAQSRNYEQELKLERSSYRKMGAKEEQEGNGKIAIQIKPKKSKTTSGLSNRSEVSKKLIRAPSIEERLAKFAAVGSPEFQVSLKSPRSRRSSNPEQDYGVETAELFSKQRFRVAADTFKIIKNKDENANKILRTQSLKSALVGKTTQGRQVVHKSHEINQTDHTKDAMRNRDGTKEISKLSLHRPVMQPEDQDQFPLRRKAIQAKKSTSPVIDYQGPQQALGRFGVLDRKGTAKQTQQWSEQEADQPNQQKSNSLIREQGKSLSHHIFKQADFNSFASSRVNSNPASSVQSSKPISLSNSFTSSKLQQFSAAISSSQREKPQQGPRGGIFYSSKLQGFKSVDTDRDAITSPSSSIKSARKIDANSWKSHQQSPTTKLQTASHTLTRPVEKNNNIVWITDSATASSDEDRIIETDSSTTTSCSVIDERRRRRLVKRTKKRGQANRKSQLSQFIGREVSAIESQTSDDGASRASPSVNENIEDVISPDEDIEEVSPKESYQRARQIFEKKKPAPEPKSLLKTVPKVQKTGYEIATVDKVIETGLKSINTPSSESEKAPEMSAYHSSLVSLASMDLETINLTDGLRRGRRGRGAAFSAVAKVSKITIPSLQMRNFSPPGKYRHNSDTESYAGQSKILSDPFNLGRSRYRDNNQGFSDGEHELTARLERNEEISNDQEAENSFDYSRRCYTLPRNIGRKKMQESPFQLNFKGKLKGKDYLEIQSNSQSSIEDASLRVLSYLSKKDSTNKIQSKSTGCIGNDSGQLPNDTSNNDLIANESQSQSGTESSSTITNFNTKAEFRSAEQEEKSSKSIEIINGDGIRENGAVASPVSNPQSSSPCYYDLIAPPDNFSDFPVHKQIIEKEIIERETSKLESELIFSSELVSDSMKSRSISKPASLELEMTRGRPLVNQENQESHDRAESPRRRPSYIKAQFTDSLFWPDTSNGDLVAKETEVTDSFEMPKLPQNEDRSVLHSPSDEKDILGQKKKRARPRIPSSLEPIKSIDDELLLASTIEIDTKSPDKLLLEKPKNEEISNFQEIIKAETESVLNLDNKKHEKSEIVKRRPRVLLAAPPMLEEIPEEKSHGSGSDTTVARTSDLSNIKARKGRKHANILQAPLLLDDVESLDGRDSPRTEKSDKSETGYFSRSLSSTPNQLSSLDDMMSSDSPTFGGVDFVENEAFKQTRVMNLFSGSPSDDANRSRSDPIPSHMATGQATLIREDSGDTIPTKWTSNSEPNLVANNRTLTPETKKVATTQDVRTEAKDVPKADQNRKGSVESSESVRSPAGSPFDQHGFPQQRSDSQKSFSSNTSVPDSPIGIPSQKPKQKPDMRRHVLQNLLDTEKSYVQNLNFLVTVYYKPLKKAENASVIETSQVNEIFFQIPEILVNHEFFLEQLNNRANCWTDKQIVGDIFVSSFTKCLLMDAYSSFINHYLQARATVRLASLRPPFAKFLEQCCKEHKEKLTLQDLMIQPVQRIPRYVLILKDMLKHTSQEHPDYGLLQLALEEIKTLAERMNKGEMEADQAEKEAEKLRDIEATIEGITDLVTSTRKFIRQDLVAEIKGVITKKDRCIFLFSDLLVCATVRRKNNALRRGSLVLFSGQSATEFNRYKLLWKLPLDTTELVKGGTASTPKRVTGDKQIERLEEDIAILAKISSMSDTLLVPHQNLDMSIREITAELNRQVTEQSQTAQPMQTTLAKVELQVQMDDGAENFVFVFLSTIIKSSWEAVYEDAKQKLAYARHTFPPEFQYPLPIDKTRSGMQFTCAAPSRLTNIGDVISEQSRGDVWVCNSDGYVGQVCLVSMVPEAQSRPCVTVCSARIQCISPVPGSKLISTNRTKTIDQRKLPRISESRNRKKGSKSKSSSNPPLKAKKSLPSESDEDDATVGPETIIPFDSTDEEDNDIGSTFIGGTAVFGGRMSPDGSSLGTVESVEGLDGSSSDNPSYQSANDTSDDDETQQAENRRISMPLGTAVRRGNHGYTLKGSLDDLLSEENEEQPTMWLGTEDGSIHVYQSSDVTQVRKSKMKMQLGAVVNAILYQENKVFVALANGELIVYKRDPGNGWEVACPQTIPVGPNGSSITSIAAAAGRIWCGCQNNIILVNASTLKIESTIQVSQDSHRSVYRIVSSGLGVWISLQSSAVVRLYHATSYENLADIDVAPAVHKMLAGADAIIRQHKAACLRVTALQACKDLLWIGTSAGVVLTNPLPTIKINTRSLRNAPGPTGSPHGHTGHVRFLTSVEVPKSQFKQAKLLTPEPVSSNRPVSPLPQRSTKTVAVARKDDSSKTVILVISGGDGYEDFRTSATSEAVGREDSTNHLLIWRV